MNTTTNAIDGRAIRRPSRHRRAGRLVALLVALGLLVAACGDDGASPSVAAVDSTTTTQPGSDDGSSSDPSASPDPVAYSQCMRDNGVPGFPDPNSNGEHAIDASKLGISPDSPQYQAAADACASLLPRRSDEQQAEDYQAALLYAQCMRDEGLTSFPDPPVPTDGPTTNSNSGQQDPGFAPDSPQFQAAHDACKDLLPAGAEGPSVSTSGDG